MRIIVVALILSVLLGVHFCSVAAVLARDLPDAPVLSDLKMTLAEAAAANW